MILLIIYYLLPFNTTEPPSVTSNSWQLWLFSIEVDLSKELTASSSVKEEQVEDIQVCSHFEMIFSFLSFSFSFALLDDMICR